MNKGPLISVVMPARSDYTPTLGQYFSIDQRLHVIQILMTPYYR